MNSKINSLSNLDVKDAEIIENFKSKLVLNTSNQYMGRNNNINATDISGSETMKQRKSCFQIYKQHDFTNDFENTPDTEPDVGIYKEQRQNSMMERKKSGY